LLTISALQPILVLNLKLTLFNIKWLCQRNGGWGCIWRCPPYALNATYLYLFQKQLEILHVPPGEYFIQRLFAPVYIKLIRRFSSNDSTIQQVFTRLRSLLLIQRSPLQEHKIALNLSYVKRGDSFGVINFQRPLSHYGERYSFFQLMAVLWQFLNSIFWGFSQIFGQKKQNHDYQLVHQGYSKLCWYFVCLVTN
jgi:hypothetical protein